MPRFPRRECDISMLADTMLSGLVRHGAEFPHVSRVLLRARLVFYRHARKKQRLARQSCAWATAAKDGALTNLTRTMKRCLRQSEVDVAAVPAKLSLIGWGPRCGSTEPVVVPGPPRRLRLVKRDHQRIVLGWDPPATGTARNYLIETCPVKTGANAWKLAAICCATTSTVAATQAPQCCRVRAVNLAGASSPSNTLVVAGT